MSERAFIAPALFCGAFLAMQGLISSKLNTAFSSPLIAALISFRVGLAWLEANNAVMIVSGKTNIPKMSMASGLPWWARVGGPLGACIVVLSAATAPRLGARLVSQRLSAAN